MSCYLLKQTNPAYRVLRAFLWVGAMAVTGSAVAATCHVTSTGAGSNNGTSWDNAMKLQTALATGSGCNEVWVKAGIYKPTAGTDISISFKIPHGVAVYGGFAGTESSLNQRNPATHITTLSGDIGTSDIVDNTNQVVLITGSHTGSTVLDGFTINGGHAFNGSSIATCGGGLHCMGGGSNPTLANLVFSNNMARTGGALCLYGDASPTLTNVTFSDNHATETGGAIYSGGSNGFGETSKPILTNVTFRNNSAGFDGGAMYNTGDIGNNSSPTLINVTFSGNNGYRGGAMFNGGQYGISSPSLTNVTFSNNSATFGGGAMFNDDRNGTSTATVTNVTFSDNSADEFGGTLYNVGNGSHNGLIMINAILSGGLAGTSPEIHNNNAFPIIADSVIEGGCISGDGSICINVSTADPLLGLLQDNGGFTQTMLLGPGSSAIDAGNETVCPSDDQRGVPRPQGARCDIGATEYFIDIIFADGFDSD